MAPAPTHPLLSDCPPISLNHLEASDKALLAALPHTTLDGVVALGHAIHDDFRSKAIPSAVNHLPSRRVHELRPHMEAIARAVYPDLSPIKAVINYEASRKGACSIVRAAEKEARALHEALAQGFRIQDLQGPWAGQDADPVSLAGPQALPMPVQIGEARHFEDCFRFLAANQDPNEFYPGGASKPKSPDDYNLHLGNELVWETPLVEFDRGAVYVDRRLDLCKMVVGPTHIGSLMDSLRSNEFVTHFLLGNNVISATGANAVAAFIEDKPNQMETWYLAGNHIKTEGFARLAAAMATSTRLTNVWLKRNPLGPGAVDALAQLILGAPHLRTLDLENTELGDAGIARLFELLRGKPFALKNIFLNADGLGEEGTAALAAALEAGWQPESLMLASNPLGDAGAAHLARALRTNRSVVRLGLSSAGLTSAGIGTLADALAAHPAIRSVVFSPLLTTAVHGQRYNHVDDAAVPALARLVANPGLRVLELGRTALSPDGVDALRNAVAESELCAFQAFHAAPGQSCALRVRRRLEEDVRKYYGTDLKTFENGLGLRFLRNTPDVRLIDSVYRTRDKRKGSENIKQYWDEGDPVWAMVDADWDSFEGGQAVSEAEED